MEERKGDLGGKKVIGMPWVRMDVERKIAQHHFWLEKWLVWPSGGYRIEESVKVHRARVSA